MFRSVALIFLFSPRKLMSGYHALKGFEYQAVVSLTILLEQFADAARPVRVRPEGSDDLEVRSLDNPTAPVHYYQIKKPREYDDGRLKQQPWRLLEAADELLPTAVRLLRGNQHRQIWLLGDAATPALQALLDPAAPDFAASYVRVLHRLARQQSGLVSEQGGLSASAKKLLSEWQPPAGPRSSLAALVTSTRRAFLRLAAHWQLPVAARQAYSRQFRALHADLPGVLSRIELHEVYGTDQQLRTTIAHTLQARYGLAPEVVQYALLGNLRSFIQDAATRRNHWIDREEFELELRLVWPKLTHLAEPPALPSPYVLRPDLVRELTQPVAAGGCLALTGASGAGKTALARELLLHVRAGGQEALYAEVRPAYSLRDVLSGVAFHLRRGGNPEPFRQVIALAATDEHVVRTLGQSLRPYALVVLLDLVEGACSEAFARELAQFAAASSGGSLRLVVLGQENGLRALTDLERVALCIPAARDVPGLTFEEFEELTEQHGHRWDRGELYTIFTHFTGGRSAGLLARLADTLARQATLADVHRLMQLPPHEVLAAADRERYLTITDPAVRAAADQLVCMALPFQLDEAAAIFPRSPIRLAGLALAQRGLLRHHDPERWEIHETIRAGLESLLPPAVYQQTHRQLAAAYGARADLPSQLLHLERGGQRVKAQRLARAAFAAGTDFDTLAPLAAYLGTRHAVTAREAAAWLAQGEGGRPKQFLLMRLVVRLGSPSTAAWLVAELRRQAGRFDTDTDWSQHMVRATLGCDPASLDELLFFCLEKPDGDEYPRLEALDRGLVQHRPALSPTLLQFYEAAPATIKAALTSLLLLDKRRVALTPAFQFVSQFVPPAAGPPGRALWTTTPLQLSGSAEVEEFLMALPPVTAGQLVARGGMEFGRLEPWVWQERGPLRDGCVSLLQAAQANEATLFAALRVLLFLGDAQVPLLAVPLAHRPGELGHLAALVPLLLPATADLPALRACLLDVQVPTPRRVLAFTILLGLTEDADALYAELQHADPAQARHWEILLLFSIPLRPTLSAVPLLDAHLIHHVASEAQARLFGPSILRLADLPNQSVTDLLLRCLHSPWVGVCHVALVALQRRRSTQALPALLAFCQRTPHELLRYEALVAAIASGPTDPAAFAAVWPLLPPRAAGWRCLLAARLADESAASYLHQVATAEAADWSARRAAVLAAGYLPDAQTLAGIATRILADPAAFPLDEHPHLLGHALLSLVLDSPLTPLRPLFSTHPAEFLQTIAAWFDELAAPSSDRAAAPSGVQAAQWLFDQLTLHGWTRNPAAPEQVRQQVHRPLVQAAVFKSLRRAGKFEQIEQLISSLSNSWLVAVAVTEWSRPSNRSIGAADWQRLATLLAGRPAALGLNPLDVLAHCQEVYTRPARSPAPVPPSAPGLYLRYDDVKTALSSGILAEAAAIVLVDLTNEQVVELAQLLDPRYDVHTNRVLVKPSLNFTNGGFTIQAEQFQSVQPTAPLAVRTRLRPALAAANGTGVPLSWHTALLQAPPSYQQETYLTQLLASLGAQQQAARFYAELATHAWAMLAAAPAVYSWLPVAALLDEHLLPTLLQFAETGPDTVLQTLCWLASHLPSPAADPALRRLFDRWCRRFSPPEPGQLAHSDNPPLWHAFTYLQASPRFPYLPAYDLRLEEILALPLTKHHRQHLAQAVAHCPSAYVRQEKLLLTVTPFGLHFLDGLEQADCNAARLFRQVSP
jgi:hypothetical protein